MYFCVCVREREREREREAEGNSVEIILYPSSEDIHNAGNSPVSPTTRGQTIILVEITVFCHMNFCFAKKNILSCFRHLKITDF